MRRLGAGFSDFNASEPCLPDGTILTVPMCTKLKMYYIGAYSFSVLSLVFLQINQLKINV
jgi:hypothetical protein